MEVVRSSEPSSFAQVRTGGLAEAQSFRADEGEQCKGIENLSEIPALEKEEQLLVEAIITAKAGSAVVAQSDDLKAALRELDLATTRYAAGTGTQVDLLSAQSALVEACGSYVDALKSQLLARTALTPATDADLQGSTVDTQP